MTCPLSAPHSPPKTFRELEHYKTSQKEARKFCCTLDEKKKELPNFDPNTHEDPEYKYIYRRDWYHFGFWNTLLVTSTLVLLLGLMLYIVSCLFVEVFEMIMFVLCYCCRKK